MGLFVFSYLNFWKIKRANIANLVIYIFFPQLIEFLSQSFAIETQESAGLVLSLLREIIASIDVKLRSSEQSKEEKKKRLEEIQGRIKKLSKFTDMDSIAREAEKELFAACDSYAKSNTAGIEREADQICNTWTPRIGTFEEVTLELQYVVLNTVTEALIAKEVSAAHFAKLKENLLQRLKAHLGSFGGELSAVQSGVGRQVEKSSKGLLAGSSFRLFAPVAGGDFFLSSPEAQRRRSMRQFDKSNFNKNYTADKMVWARSYTVAFLRQCYTAEFIKERVEKFLYSPQHLVRNLVEEIKKAVKNEGAFLNDLKKEERDSESLHRTLDPIRVFCNNLLERAERLLRRVQSQMLPGIDDVKPEPTKEEMLFEAVRAIDLETVSAIVASSPDLSLRPFGCFTPLHFACALGHVGLVDLLLNSPKMNPNVLDAGGSTPFLIACAEGHLDVVKRMTRDRRVDINLPDPNNAAPLWWAAFWGRDLIIQQLISCGRHLDLDIQKERSLFSGTTIKQIANRRGKTTVYALLDSYTSNPLEARKVARAALGSPETAIEGALGVWLSDLAEITNKEIRLIDCSHCAEQV